MFIIRLRRSRNHLTLILKKTHTQCLISIGHLRGHPPMKTVPKQNNWIVEPFWSRTINLSNWHLDTLVAFAAKSIKKLWIASRHCFRHRSNCIRIVYLSIGCSLLELQLLLNMNKIQNFPQQIVIDGDLLDYNLAWCICHMSWRQQHCRVYCAKHAYRYIDWLDRFVKVRVNRSL